MTDPEPVDPDHIAGVPPGGMLAADRAYESIRRRRGRPAADRIRRLAEQLAPDAGAGAWPEAEDLYDLEVAAAAAGTGWCPDA